MTKYVAMFTFGYYILMLYIILDTNISNVIFVNIKHAVNLI